MDTLNIFCAGAAQAIVARLAQDFELQNACLVVAHYGAVQSMKARVLVGEPCDIVILTDVLIDELITGGKVTAGSRADLGAVGTGVAVRANTPVPAVGSLQSLRDAMLASDKVHCPDPAAATAGKVLLKVLDELGISEQMRPRLNYCASGHEAMSRLAGGTGTRELGVMQMTEIIASRDIELAGPLPATLQNMAVYSAGLSSTSAAQLRARDFIRQLTEGRDALLAAGFGVVQQPAQAGQRAN